MEKSEADARCAEAVRFAVGDGVPQDLPKAEAMFREVAEEGYPQGMFGLADMAMGKGEVESAIPLYEKAAELGSLPASFRLGNIYWSGEREDHARSRACFERCAEGEFEYAYNKMGDIHFYGYGGPRDVSKAIEWYSKAASVGDASAMFKLGCIYDGGTDVSRDEATALRMFMQAAFGGVPEAQLKMATLAYEGRTEGGKREAARWYESCMDAIPVAKFNLATMYYGGDGIGMDVPKAYSLYRELAEQGDTDAMFQIGKMLVSGEGVGRDAEQGFRWIGKAAKAGHAEAKLVAGNLMRRQNAQLVEIKDQREDQSLLFLTEQWTTDSHFSVPLHPPQQLLLRMAL